MDGIGIEKKKGKKGNQHLSCQSSFFFYLEWDCIVFTSDLVISLANCTAGSSSWAPFRAFCTLKIGIFFPSSGVFPIANQVSSELIDTQKKRGPLCRPLDVLCRLPCSSYCCVYIGARVNLSGTPSLSYVKPPSKSRFLFLKRSKMICISYLTETVVMKARPIRQWKDEKETPFRLVTFCPSKVDLFGHLLHYACSAASVRVLRRSQHERFI